MRRVGARIAHCLALMLVLGQLALLLHYTQHAIAGAGDEHVAACVFVNPVLDPPATPAIAPPIRHVVASALPSAPDSPAPAARAQLGFRAHAPPRAPAPGQQT